MCVFDRRAERVDLGVEEVDVTQDPADQQRVLVAEADALERLDKRRLLDAQAVSDLTRSPGACLASAVFELASVAPVRWGEASSGRAAAHASFPLILLIGVAQADECSWAIVSVWEIAAFAS